MIALFRPFYLLGGFLLYALGAGIAHYLGRATDWHVYLLGQAVVTLLQLGTLFLDEYFVSLSALPGPIHRAEGQPHNDEPFHLGRWPSLLGSATVLTMGTFFTLQLIRAGDIHLEALTILIVAFLIAIFYATPPVQLNHSGFGELADAIFLANLVPAFAFLLQAGFFHRLLAMTTFPLTLLYLAMALALTLPTYAEDIKQNKRVLMVRLGWQRGMNWHNLLILCGFLLIGLAMISGLPWKLGWPTFLALPVGLFQIWQMVQIRSGARPRYRLLVVTAVATFALVAYLFTFTFWIS